MSEFKPKRILIFKMIHKEKNLPLISWYEEWRLEYLMLLYGFLLWGDDENNKIVVDAIEHEKTFYQNFKKNNNR